MLNFGKDKDTEPKSTNELIKSLLKRMTDMEDKLDDLIEALGGEEGLSEKKELKQELKQANNFVQTLCLTLVENSKAVNIAAASKPSTMETYLANKNAAAVNTSSVKDLNKTLNNGTAAVKLPG